MKDYFSFFTDIIKNHFKLFGLEALLAKRSLVPFCISFVAAIATSLLSWLFLLFLIGYSHYQLYHNLFLALGIPFILNSIVMLVLIFISYQFLCRLQFLKTRERIHYYWEQWPNEALNTANSGTQQHTAATAERDPRN